MPRGGFRPGAGAPLGNRNRAKRPAPSPPGETGFSGETPPRPRFESGREFAIWALNAPDSEAPIEVKVRAMQALVAAEAKQATPDKKPANPAETAETALGGRYAPRRVRGFVVVEGGK